MQLTLDLGLSADVAQQSVTNQDGTTCSWTLNYSSTLGTQCQYVEPEDSFEVSEINRSAVGPAIEDLWTQAEATGGGVGADTTYFSMRGTPIYDYCIFVVLADETTEALAIQFDGTEIPQ